MFDSFNIPIVIPIKIAAATVPMPTFTSFPFNISVPMNAIPVSVQSSAILILLYEVLHFLAITVIIASGGNISKSVFNTMYIPAARDNMPDTQ